MIAGGSKSRARRTPITVEIRHIHAAPCFLYSDGDGNAHNLIVGDRVTINARSRKINTIKYLTKTQTVNMFFVC